MLINYGYYHPSFHQISLIEEQNVSWAIVHLSGYYVFVDCKLILFDSPMSEE